MQENPENNLATRLLTWSLMALAFYFALVALAHMSGVKFPLLFVYFNVSSHAYQDKIISFMTFGWAIFFFTTARDPLRHLQFVRAAIFAGACAVAALAYINLTTDFAALSKNIKTWPFWLETLLLALIVAWLYGLYIWVQKASNKV
jgi:hypothetical protein